jgi:enterochelin esterase-like enzyme
MTDILARAKNDGTPLIDGETVTFVWEGETAPFVQIESNNWQAVEMTESESGVWTHTITLPRDAYIEYNFTTEPGNNKAILVDPLNPRKTPSGLGWDNNYLDMPEVKHTTLHQRRRGIKRGTITKHIITSDFLLAGGKREVWLYKPPVEQAVPLLVVYDGKDYYRRANLPEIVNNLIADGKIQPIALAMIEHAGKMRFVEYINGEIVLAIINQLVFPLAKQHLNLLDVREHQGAYGVVGASMGGLMAMHTGLRLPHIFGRVISQSGAFFADRTDGLFEGTGYINLAETLIHHIPKPNLHIWQDVGQFEWLLDDNRRVHALLKEKGYAVTYREYAGGHNYPCWRDMLPDALMTVFGS